MCQQLLEGVWARGLQQLLLVVLVRPLPPLLLPRLGWRRREAQSHALLVLQPLQLQPLKLLVLEERLLLLLLLVWQRLRRQRRGQRRGEGGCQRGNGQLLPATSCVGCRCAGRRGLLCLVLALLLLLLELVQQRTGRAGPVAAGLELPLRLLLLLLLLLWWWQHLLWWQGQVGATSGQAWFALLPQLLRLLICRLIRIGWQAHLEQPAGHGRPGRQCGRDSARQAPPHPSRGGPKLTPALLSLARCTQCGPAHLLQCPQRTTSDCGRWLRTLSGMGT